MQEENDTHKMIFEDPTWSSIAEFSPGDDFTDEDGSTVLMVGPLFQTIRRLGLPPEYLKRIEGTVSETTRGARSQSHPCSQDLPVRIRLFCSKKTLGRLYHSGGQVKGGWGYYVIERSRDLPNASCRDLCRVVEVYLFREGE
jgi:hypothetical protein